MKYSGVGSFAKFKFHLILSFFFWIIFQKASVVQAMADFTSKTLKTYLEYTCEGQSLYLHCPVNTTLLINGAIYGRPAPSLYNLPNDGPRASLSSDNTLVNLDGKICGTSPHNGSKVVKPRDRICISPHSMEKVVKLCQDKQDCQIFASNSIFNDPCPNVFKYLQVSYRCQPSEFMNKITCQNEEMILRCNKLQRIMIFYATYGIQPGGNILCKKSITATNQLRCEATNTTQVIRTKCYGFQNCKILISDALFGNPCINLTRTHEKYLSVVYSCVNKKILRDEYVFDNSALQSKIKTMVEGQNKTYPLNDTIPDYNGTKKSRNALVLSIFGFFSMAKSNREKIVLYFAMGCCVGLFIVFIVLIFRIFDHKLFNFYVLLKVCCSCCFKSRHKSHAKSRKGRSFRRRNTKHDQSNGNLRYIPHLDQDLEYNKFDHNYDSFSRFKFTSTHPTNFEALTSPTNEF